MYPKFNGLSFMDNEKETGKLNLKDELCLWPKIA
jgi:hypothetical protein